MGWSWVIKRGQVRVDSPNLIDPYGPLSSTPPLLKERGIKGESGRRNPTIQRKKKERKMK